MRTRTTPRAFLTLYRRYRADGIPEVGCEVCGTEPFLGFVGHTMAGTEERMRAQLFRRPTGAITVNHHGVRHNYCSSKCWSLATTAAWARTFARLRRGRVTP